MASVLSKNHSIGMNHTNRKLQTKADWRRHGKAYRKELLKQDDIEGGRRFVINKDCRVQQYFGLADKALVQFSDAYHNKTDNDIDDVFIMGHRWIAFCDHALPAHPQYHLNTSDVTYLRNKSRHELDWIRRKLEIVSQSIDEHHFNKYILDDLNGYNQYDLHNQSLSSLLPRTTPRSSAGQWESFTSTFPPPEEDWVAFPQDMHLAESKMLDSLVQLVDPSPSRDPPPRDASPPPIQIYESVDEDDYVRPGVGYGYLRQIAKEDFAYENDSEAADSWAESDDDDKSLGKLRSRSAFSGIVSNAIRRRAVERTTTESPFRKINCFMRLNHYDDENGHRQYHLRCGHNRGDEEKRLENATTCATIETVPSDEEPLTSQQPLQEPRRVRFNEKGNRVQLYVPDSRIQGRERRTIQL